MKRGTKQRLRAKPPAYKRRRMVKMVLEPRKQVEWRYPSEAERLERHGQK